MTFMIGPLWIFGNALLMLVGSLAPPWLRLACLPLALLWNGLFLYLAWKSARLRRVHSRLGRHRLTAHFKA